VDPDDHFWRELEVTHGYRVTAELGRGGMSLVVAAERTADGTPVALKVSRPVGDPRARARVSREIAILRCLHHPSIVRLLADGVTAGEPFAVLERVEGRSLSSLLSEQGALAGSTVALLVSKLAKAVQAAHDAGVIHQDLKPGNVLIVPGPPEVKLIDFGVANHAGGDGSRQAPAGTEGYMSPEQRTGGEVTPACDQFALAALAFEMLTGKRALGQQVICGEEIDWPAARGRMGPALEAVLRRALSRSAADRFASVSSFAGAFERAVLEEARPLRPPQKQPWAAYALFVAILVDLLLRTWEVGAINALRSLALEPSKAVFEACLLPSIFSILQQRFPRRALSTLLRREPAATAVMVLAAIVAGALLVTSDARESICSRLPPPEDIAQASARQELATLRAAPFSDASAAARRERYQEVLRSLRGASCTYSSLASGRAVYSACLTGLGALATILAFFGLYLRVRAPAQISDYEANGLLVVACMFAVWPLLRVITDYAEGFGNLDASKYATWPSIIGLSTIPSVLILIADRRRRALLAVAVLLVGALVPIAIHHFRPSPVLAVLAWWTDVSPTSALVVMITLAITLLALSRAALSGGRLPADATIEVQLAR
jgi:predicted Ser/Thr protein kinase